MQKVEGAPASDDQSTAGYWASTLGGDTQALWNEPWAPNAPAFVAALLAHA